MVIVLDHVCTNLFTFIVNSIRDWNHFWKKNDLVLLGVKKTAAQYREYARKPRQYNDRHYKHHAYDDVNSPHKGPVTRKMFPFDDVIMNQNNLHVLRMRCWNSPNVDMITTHYLLSGCLILIYETDFIGHNAGSKQNTVYPKKCAQGFCFAVLCCGYTLTDFPISIRLTSLALWQSNDCPSASKATLMNMDKYFMWIHYERLHNHNKAKHNKTVCILTVCIFLGIYCRLQQ